MAVGSEHKKSAVKTDSEVVVMKKLNIHLINTNLIISSCCTLLEMNRCIWGKNYYFFDLPENSVQLFAVFGDLFVWVLQLIIKICTEVSNFLINLITVENVHSYHILTISFQ